MSSLAILERPTGRAMRLNAVTSYFEPSIAAAVFVLLVWQAPWISAQFAAKDGWSASSLYAGVFSWASIQAGFLFGIYTFIVPKSEPFVMAIAATKHFRSFKAYMLQSTYITLAVTLIAFGYTVVNPKPAPYGISAVLFAAWLSLVVLSALAFLKVIRSFRKLARSR